MASVDLVEFDATLAVSVAGWPVSAQESVRWCGRADVTPEIVAGWGAAADVQAFTLVDAGALVGYGELWLDGDEVELARHPLVGAVHVHRGDDDPVLQLERADPGRSEHRRDARGRA